DLSFFESALSPVEPKSGLSTSVFFKLSTISFVPPLPGVGFGSSLGSGLFPPRPLFVSVATILLFQSSISFLFFLFYIINTFCFFLFFCYLYIFLSYIIILS